MKSFLVSALCKTIATTAAAILCYFISEAQVESHASISKTTAVQDTWYSQPWAWVIGAGVVILVILALFRASSSTNKVTYTKSIGRE